MGTIKRLEDQNGQTSEEALTGLRLVWGDRYEITGGENGKWQAARKGTGGALLTAEDPWSLRVAIIRDYSEARHPR